MIIKTNASSKMLVPTINQSVVIKNEYVHIDVSSAPEGYIAVRYKGSKSGAKLQIYKNSYSVYTYDLKSGKDYEYFPFSDGDGYYTIAIYEPVAYTRYKPVYSVEVNVMLRNSNSPFLYPSQFVDFNTSSRIVYLSNSLAQGCKNDVEIINSIYSYVATNISYDYAKYDTLSSGYVPSPDQVLKEGKGICFDFAALMTAMLRAQGIPAKLEMGTYSNGSYHAWVSVYASNPSEVKGSGSINGNWCLVDPTLASTQNNAAFTKAVSSGTNYVKEFSY